MKPLYAILLVFGAALAGGLAFELSQPKPIELAANAPEQAITPSVAESPKAPVPAVPTQPVRRKPSPMPAVDRSTVDRYTSPAYTSAPPAVYQEKAEATPVRPTPRAATPAMPPPPPQRTASSKPLQWSPVPYQRPAGSSAAVQALVAKPAPQENKLEAKLETTSLPQSAPQPASQVSAPQKPVPRHVTLPTGMAIAIRLSEPLSAERATAGDHFRGALIEPLVVDGLVIAERGARVTGRVVETQKQNWMNHKSLLELELSTVSTSDGQEVSVPSDPWSLVGGDQPASASTGTVIHFRLAGKVIVTERPL